MFSRFGEGSASGVALAVVVSHGVVGSCDHAHTLTSSRRRDQSRAPSLDRPFQTGVNGTMDPSDSRPARSAFAFGLYGPPSPDSAPGTGLSCSASNSVRMPSSIPRGRPASLRSFSDAVCCLRRGMSGSASPTFRVLISRGCKVRLMLGLRTCSPPASCTTGRGPLTPHSDAGFSSLARGLLHGAPALAVTGLAPVSST